jgi:hypothetical protein
VNYKKIFKIDIIIVFILAILIFFIKKEIIISCLIGFLTGIFNFAMIVGSVKFTFSDLIKTKIWKIILTIIFYIFKIIVIGLILYALIIYRQLYNLFYFLIGFTISLIPVFVVGVNYKKIRS